jgi:hypothetical protein
LYSLFDFPWKRGVDRDVEQQNVDARFAEETELAALDVAGDERSD